MKPFRIKHIPTGLYYQPQKHLGSHLSKKGKVYFTKSAPPLVLKKEAMENGTIHSRSYTIYCKKDSNIHKITSDIINWIPSWNSLEMKYETLLTDWEIEYLT